MHNPRCDSMSSLEANIMKEIHKDVSEVCRSNDTPEGTSGYSPTNTYLLVDS